MLLKSGFSGLLTSNGIGTTEIGPQPQSQSTSQHEQPQSVIGGSVSTFRAPLPPPPSILSNGSPLRMNNNSLQGFVANSAAVDQHQFVNLSDPAGTTTTNSFKINTFQKNGSSTLYAIANRNANGTMAVNDNVVLGGEGGGHPGGTLIKSEVGKLKSALHHPQQQMPFPPTSTPQQGLNNHNITVPSQVGHSQLPEQTTAASYLHQSHNNGLDIDQRQYVSSGVAAGGAMTEDIPAPPPPSMTLPIDCFSMTNHQRHDEIQLLNQIQDRLKEGWTVHLAENGRLYYCK